MQRLFATTESEIKRGTSATIIMMGFLMRMTLKMVQIQAGQSWRTHAEETVVEIPAEPEEETNEFDANELPSKEEVDEQPVLPRHGGRVTFSL